ncbi:MAG TPA: nucleotidyltransferase family protein [Armatimonadota bacterium]|nr:nucleotidyltransferase family protein [Armatimonadota bacterium]
MNGLDFSKMVRFGRPADQHLLPHERALLACARPDPADARRELGHALRSPDNISRSLTGINWGLLVAKSIRHGLILQLALYLRDYRSDPLAPPAIAARVESLYEGSAFRTEVLLREAARLIRALDGAGIPVILLKGPALAQTVYPDWRHRPFADIDLLVDPAQCEAAGRVAAAIGYRSDSVESLQARAHQCWSFSGSEDIATSAVAPEFDAAIDSAAIARHCHRIAVEIHWTLLRDGFGCAREHDHESVFRTSRMIHFPEGAPARVLSPEAALVHLAQHAVQHAWTRLLFAQDISLVIQRSDGGIDWDSALSLAHSFGVSSALRGGLIFVHRELGVPVPAEAMESRQSLPIGREAWAPHGSVRSPPDAVEAKSERSTPTAVVGWSRHRLSPAYVLRADDAPGHEIVIRRWLMARAPWIRPSILLRWLIPTGEIVRDQYGVRGRFRRALFYPYRMLRLVRITIGVLIRLIGTI